MTDHHPSPGYCRCSAPCVFVLKNDSNIGILVLPWQTDRRHHLDALKRGADFYFTKPIDLELLATPLQNMAHRFASKQKVREMEHRTVASARWRLEAGG